MIRRRRGFIVLIALMLLAFTGAMLTAGTLAVVSASRTVDRELAELRARAAAQSLVSTAAALSPDAPGGYADVVTDLTDAHAEAEITPDGEGALVLDIEASGTGDMGVEATLNVKVVIMRDAAGRVTIISWQQ